jgi:ribonuclease P protein component
VLPRAHRITRADDFRTVMRRGRHARGRFVASHVLAGDDGATRVGFVVGKAVGGAVQRNLVRRRLRAIASESLVDLRPGSSVVIRALPTSADAGFGPLRDDTREQLRRAAGGSGS